MVCLGSLGRREAPWPAALTSGWAALCAQPQGGATDADNEALPAQPNRRGEASAEERLDTAPDLENRNRQDQPALPPLSSLRGVLFIVGGGQQREPVQKRKQPVGAGKAFFRSVQQTCFADRGSPSWKGINEWEGYLSFPLGNKVPVLTSASKTVRHLRSSAVVPNK